MEAHRHRLGPRARALAVAPERVLARQPHGAVGETPAALVQDAEFGDVAIMARGQDRGPVLRAPLDRDRTGTAQDHGAAAVEQPAGGDPADPPILRLVEEAAGGGVGDRRGRVCGGAPRRPAQLAAARGTAAIDDDALRPARQFEGEAAGGSLTRLVHRRRRADIADEHDPPQFEPGVAGMRGVHQRLGAGPVIDQQRGEMVGRRHTHPVEVAERGIAVPQEPQRRQHPVDGAQERFRRIDAAAEEALAQGQQIEQQLHGKARIAGSVAAVRQDLRFEFAHEDAGGPAQDRLDALAAQPGIGQRHRRQQARLRR